MILLVTILWSYDSCRWERRGTIGKKPPRSALRWLDLRVPFTEVVGPVLKAAQAGLNPTSNMDLPTCKWPHVLTQPFQIILTQSFKKGSFLVDSGSCSITAATLWGAVLQGIVAGFLSERIISLVGHCNKGIVREGFCDFHKYLSNFTPLIHCYWPLSLWEGLTTYPHHMLLASWASCGHRSRGVSAGFKHKERIPGLHSAQEGVRQLRMMKKS